MSKILWNKRALKQIRKIPAKFKKAIIAAVEDLPTTDGWRNVIPLTNHQYMYRLRVGRFRVFFDLDQNEVKIYLIQEVKKRDARTY
jgi:mRNA-degrading endonuclease RelE of RelBE toxin-antitoxin system